MKILVTNNEGASVFKTAHQVAKENNCKVDTNGYPTRFNGVKGYQYDTTHYQDGWRDFVAPTFNTATHKQTNEFEEIGQHPNRVVSYKVVEKTQEEIDAYEEAQVPLILTASQLRQSLVLAGINLQSVVDAINTLPSPQKELVLVKWEYENTYNRTSPEVIAISQIVGLDDEALKQIYITGSEL